MTYLELEQLRHRIQKAIGDRYIVSEITEIVE